VELRSERNAAWIETYCRIPEGKLVGQPPKLTPEQRRWLKLIYDSPTRTFILSMARKNAKTAFSAFLLQLHLCGSSTAYGLSPAFAVHDELGQVRGPQSDLYDAIESAAGAQEEPLSVVISTQAPTDGDLLSILIDDAKRNADPRTKVALYTADPEADPFDPSTIAQANPHLDVFMNRDEVLAQAEKAKRLPSQEASYRNLILNQRVEARDPFVSRAVWKGNGAEPAPLDDQEVFGGLDLSSVSDLTALVLVAPGEHYDVEATFWLPEEGIREKSKTSSARATRT